MTTIEDGVEQVSPDEAAELVEGGAFLLDVREDDEWAAGHAPQATHVRLGTVPDEHAGVVPKDGKVVAICRKGGRSQQAATFLKEQGYDVVNVVGGMEAWAASGRDVVAEDGSSGTVI